MLVEIQHREYALVLNGIPPDTTPAAAVRNDSNSTDDVVGISSAGSELNIASTACSTFPPFRRRCFRASSFEQQVTSTICSTLLISSGVMGDGLNGFVDCFGGISVTGKVVMAESCKR